MDLYVKHFDVQDDCLYCRILTGEEPAVIVRRGTHSLTIKAPEPVTEGHVITISRPHVASAIADPYFTANLMGDAVAHAQTNRLEVFSFVVNVGDTLVKHLHIHSIPREKGSSQL